MISVNSVSVAVLIVHLALLYNNVLGKKQQVQNSECFWTSWSPCTVTCLSRGSNSVYSQQWQRFICKSRIDLDNNSSSITMAKFRSCAYMIPLCVSDEGFLIAFQNSSFLAIFLICIILAFLPNMILGLRYTRVWVWKSRKSGQKSEQSVPSFKDSPSNNLLLYKN